MNARAFATTAFQRPGFDRTVPSGLIQGSFRMHRIRVESDRSAWNSSLSTRFDQLCALERGWDGYLGQPVSFACARFAATILEHLYTDGLLAPSLVPGSDGTLQIEWHRNQYDIEIDVLAPNKVVAYRNNLLSNQEDEIDISNDFTIVNLWLKEMKAVRQAQRATG